MREKTIKFLLLLLAMLIILSGCQVREEDPEIIGENEKIIESNQYYAGASKKIQTPDDGLIMDSIPPTEKLPQPITEENPQTISDEVLPELPSSVEEPVVDHRKLIALTFDDGPGSHTDRLLDILEKYDSKATFFMIGVHINGYDNTLKRIRDDGHQLASHAQNHKNLTKLTDDEAAKEMDDTSDLIFDITGVKVTAMRPPFGACDDNLKALAKTRGQSIIMWNVDTEDWKSKDTEKINKALLDDASDGAIILMHDFYSTSVDSIEQSIEALIAEGYTLVTVDELLSRNGEKPSAGTVYYSMPPAKDTEAVG